MAPDEVDTCQRNTLYVKRYPISEYCNKYEYIQEDFAIACYGIDCELCGEQAASTLKAFAQSTFLISLEDLLRTFTQPICYNCFYDRFDYCKECSSPFPATGHRTVQVVHLKFSNIKRVPNKAV